MSLVLNMFSTFVCLGLVDRVLSDAAELTKPDSIFPEYAPMACAMGGAKAIPLHFQRSDMAWTGGSIFAAEKVLIKVSCRITLFTNDYVHFMQALNEKHFINLASLQNITERDTAIVQGSGVAEESMTRLPDWQSSDSKDWTFFSPLPTTTKSC